MPTDVITNVFIHVKDFVSLDLRTWRDWRPLCSMVKGPFDPSLTSSAITLKRANQTVSKFRQWFISRSCSLLFKFMYVHAVVFVVLLRRIYYLPDYVVVVTKNMQI